MLTSAPSKKNSQRFIIKTSGFGGGVLVSVCRGQGERQSWGWGGGHSYRAGTGGPAKGPCVSLAAQVRKSPAGSRQLVAASW